MPELQNSFVALRQFARRRRAVEVCELCTHELGPWHPHLLELGKYRLVCSCEACALLFSSQKHSRYKRVPQRIQMLRDFRMSDAEWESLLIPINMAFFFKNSSHSSVTALYPSPAGATESLLTLEAWSDIVHHNPVLNEMESDVEALLVNRIAHAHGAGGDEYYLLPIDECFRLVGLIRSNWRGLSGGTEVWQEIGNFFAQLKERATVVPRDCYA